MAKRGNSQGKKADRPIHEQVGPVMLKSMPLHPIVDDKVELLVQEINRPYPGPTCNPPEDVKAFFNTWQSVSITEMVHWGTSHYQGIELDLAKGETDYLARCRKVWSSINDHKPQGIL